MRERPVRQSRITLSKPYLSQHPPPSLLPSLSSLPPSFPSCFSSLPPSFPPSPSPSPLLLLLLLLLLLREVDRVAS